MDSARGYRLKASSLVDLSRILEDFRADALRLLARRYGSLVAATATEMLDLASVGLEEIEGDILANAGALVRGRLSPSPEGIPYAELNCVVSLHFVSDAVLASFVHGRKEYRHAWESMRDVVRWGWASSIERPRGISEQNWELRGRYWQEALKRKGLGETRFLLVDGNLPAISWGGIRRHLPSFEERVALALSRVQASGRMTAEERGDEEALRSRVAEALEKELTKETFVLHAAPATAKRPAAPAPESAPQKPKSEAAERIRQEAKNARQERARKARAIKKENDKATSIDHADVIVSSDGRTFLAAPYVGLDTDSRVFVQVGDKHVAVSQGGVQFGYVTDVPKTAIDALRMCKTVILVEVSKSNGQRLLRAKHVAIVSDISLSDNLNMSLGAFKKSRDARGEREIREWESGQ